MFCVVSHRQPAGLSKWWFISLATSCSTQSTNSFNEVMGYLNNHFTTDY
jgi:hypothetical protein